MIDPATTRLRGNWRPLAVGGVLLLGLATPHVVQRHWAAVTLVAAGIIIAVSWLATPGLMGQRAVARVAVAATIVFSVTAILPGADANFWDSFPAGLRLIWAGVVLGTAAMPAARDRRFQIAMGALVIVSVSIAGAVHISYMSELSTDVIAGHRSAAAVLAEGGNPYADAVFRDSGPRYANVGEIVGYAYPPVTMIPYAVSEWLGEARWMSVLAMATAFFFVLWFGSRTPRLGLLLLGVGVTFPMLGAMYAHGWTEPLSLVFILAVAQMNGSGTPRGVALGLAVASKQYMVLTLVPMLTMRLFGRARMFAVALATGLVVTLPFLILDVDAFWHALVGSQFDRLPRIDVLSIGAFGYGMPIVVSLVVSVGVGLVLGRRVIAGWHLLLAQAATLSVYFAITTNSFRNYWFMVAFVVLGAVALSARVDDEAEGEVQLRERRAAVSST